MTNKLENGEEPLVSIITPVYNAEKYLVQTVESVLAQTHANFEYFLVDDCSTDSSRKIMKELALRDHRIKLFFLDKNCGPAKARNIGIEKSCGEFVTFIDSDDLWAPEKLARQLAAFCGRPSLGIVGVNGVLIDSEGNSLGVLIAPEKIRRGKISLADFLLEGVSLTISAMVRRVCFNRCGLFKEAYRVGEDFELWMRIIQDYEVDTLDENLLFYRRHSNNITKSKISSRYNKILIYENEILPILHKCGNRSDEILIKLQKMYTTYGKLLLMDRDKKGAIIYLNKSIDLNKSLVVTMRAIFYKLINKLLAFPRSTK